MLDHYLKGRRKLKPEQEKAVEKILSLYGYGATEPAEEVEVVEIVPEPDPPKPKNSKKKKPAKPKEESAPKNFTYTLCVDAWMVFYEKEKGESYTFKAVDGAKIKSLIKSIEQKMRQKGTDTTPRKVRETFVYFLSLVKKVDWIYKGLDLNIIDSKFNVIIAHNGKSTSTPDTISLLAEAKRRAAANKQSQG